jgi:hypothetical protein
MLRFITKLNLAPLLGHPIHTYIHTHTHTGLFKMIVEVIHNTLQMQPHVISFYGVTSRIRFMFLLFPPSIPEVKVRIRTVTADMLQTVWNEFDYRVDVCRITKGAHIEHL